MPWILSSSCCCWPGGVFKRRKYAERTGMDAVPPATSSAAAKKHALFLRFREPLFANIQTVRSQMLADTFWCITIGKKQADGFAVAERKFCSVHLEHDGAGEM